jgi:L-fucose isomerase
VFNNYGNVAYLEKRFDEERLDKMIRSYLATKSIINDFELDFLGIKCQPEMSNGYILQCLNVQLLNDPYDAEGPKEPVVCSCEADSDGALTMQILKIISGGLPTALQDIFHVDNKLMVLANCGSMASWFSKLSDTPQTNLKEVFLQPHGFGEAGGAATQFVAAAGTFTYARLYRNNGDYRMAILKGNTVKKPREALKAYSWYRPTSFVEMDIDYRKFMREYGSNHIHCVRGDFTEELIEFCRYKGIEYVVY